MIMTAGGAQAESESADSSDIEDASLADEPNFPVIEPNGMTRSQAFSLYASHFLSTWNVRTYEFAAVSKCGEIMRGR